MSNGKKKPDGDYTVGYCRPPEDTRFKPGQSGNRAGRPKKSKNIDLLIKAELEKTVPLTGDGRAKRITKLDALVMQLVNRAVKGDPKALQFIFAHLAKHRDVEPFAPTDADDAALLAALVVPDTKEDDNDNR